MIDLSKLKPPAFDDSDEDSPMHDTKPEGSPPRTPGDVRRLMTPEVGYMELADLAGAFACGNCVWVGAEAHCENPLVKAPVSAKHGCCNLFYPAGTDPTFPPDARNPREEE